MESEVRNHGTVNNLESLDLLHESRFWSLAPDQCTLNLDAPLKPSEVPYQTHFSANQTQANNGVSYGPSHSDSSADLTLVQSLPGNSLNVNQAIETLFAERNFLKEKLNSIELRMKNSTERENNYATARPSFGPEDCYGCAERDSQMQKLSAILGQAEFEREEMQRFISEIQKDFDSKKHVLQSEMDTLKSQLVSNQSKLQYLQDKNRALSQENKQFLQYKATLPTKNEFASVKHELEIVTDKKDRLKEKLVSVNKQVENLRSVEKANQSLIVERNSEIGLLKSKLEKSEENVRILESFLSKNAGNNENVELPHVTIARLMAEVAELSSDLTKHKKLVKQQRSTLVKETNTYKSQLAEMKSESQSALMQSEQLKEEMKKLQLEYRLLKASFEEVAQQNSFLSHDNESMLTENQQLKNLQLSEKFKTNKIVANQLSSCLRQMRELFSIMQKFESDKDVDISVFIGSESDQSVNRSADEQTVVPIEEKVTNLQKDIKVFRENLSDQAASKFGSECKVQ